MIDVVDKGVERVDALVQAAFQAFPFAGGNDARHQVEREDALGAGGIAVDVEGDPHLQQQFVSGVFVAEHLAIGESLDGFEQQLGLRARLSAGFEHLVVEAPGLIGRKAHRA